MTTATRIPEKQDRRDTGVMETLSFEPVEYWNALYPNEELIGRTPGPKGQGYDAAGDPSLKFFGGYFRATEPWQADLIDTYAADRAFKADVLPPAEPIRCGKCGWETRSSRAFAHHAAQEG